MKTYVSCPFFVLFILCTAWYKMVWQNYLSIFQRWPNFLYVSLGTCKTVCYASSFRRWRHYVFGLSVCPSICPSVPPKPKIPSFHLYMGPLVHPTNHDRFTACPSIHRSVRPSVLLSIHPSIRRGFRASTQFRLMVYAACMDSNNRLWGNIEVTFFLVSGILNW